MSQNNTAKVQGTNTSNQNVATPSATPQKSQMVINVDAVEVKQALSVEQIFQKFEQGKSMREFYERHVVRQKELTDFEAEASDESGFVLRCTLKSGTSIEFVHTPSNLEFVQEQIRKNDLNIKNMEEKIKEFTFTFSA